MLKKVLTIAGSDSGGGAGIQADLKTFSALGTFGMSVITAVTAQNTQGVAGVEEISPKMVGMQMDSIFTDLYPDMVKVGMVSNVEIIRMIGSKLDEYGMKGVVVDPVMISKSGCHLLRPEAVEAMIQELVSRAWVLTPNLPEAEVLTGMTLTTLDGMKESARRLHGMGARYVVIKGGHRLDCGSKSVDLLYNGSVFTEIEGERFDTKNTHGTGCTFSSAIAALLARGLTVTDAVRGAKFYIAGAIEHSLDLGQGVGPTHHFWKYYDTEGDEIDHPWDEE